MDTLKVLGVVDFTKFALSPIIEYVQWSKLASVKIAVNLSKSFLGILLIHAHLQYVRGLSIKYVDFPHNSSGFQYFITKFL